MWPGPPVHASNQDNRKIQSQQQMNNNNNNDKIDRDSFMSGPCDELMVLISPGIKGRVGDLGPISDRANCLKKFQIEPLS